MSEMSVWDWESVAQHHEEGASVVAESLQRVLVKVDRTRWIGEKGKWAKTQKLPVYSCCFILWHSDPRMYLRHLTHSQADPSALWQFKKNKVTLDFPFPLDAAQEPGGEGGQDNFPCAAALGWTVVAAVPLEIVGSSQLRKVLPGLTLPSCFAEHRLFRTFA